MGRGRVMKLPAMHRNTNTASPAEAFFFMSAFRTCRPLLVDANQCQHPGTIATDTGSRHVERGDWIIRGENGETYVVDDAFFQRTFLPFQTYPWETVEEGRPCGC
jgi:hypothetical protein